MADRAKLRAMLERAWAAPWVARTFEIDCPCPNGVHCGDLHTCEEVEAREAYPASHEEPAGQGEGQCVVQIAVPGLESLARPNAEFIAAARNELPGLLDELERLEEALRAIEGHELDGTYSAEMMLESARAMARAALSPPSPETAPALPDLPRCAHGRHTYERCVDCEAAGTGGWVPATSETKGKEPGNA